MFRHTSRRELAAAAHALIGQFSLYHFSRCCSNKNFHPSTHFPASLRREKWKLRSLFRVCEKKDNFKTRRKEREFRALRERKKENLGKILTKLRWSVCWEIIAIVPVAFRIVRQRFIALLWSASIVSQRAVSGERGRKRTHHRWRQGDLRVSLIAKLMKVGHSRSILGWQGDKCVRLITNQFCCCADFFRNVCEARHEKVFFFTKRKKKNWSFSRETAENLHFSLCSHARFA